MQALMESLTSHRHYVTNGFYAPSNKKNEMTLKERLATDEAKAAQVVIARIIDLVPNAQGAIELAESDIADLEQYINDAVALDPTNEEALGASVLLLSDIAAQSKNDKFKSFASKVEQSWGVISDASIGTIEKITQTIGILFQGKRKAIKKL